LQMETNRRDQRYWYRSGTCGTKRLPWVIVVCYIIMNREFKHWWPSTPPISTKLTITSYLNCCKYVYVVIYFCDCIWSYCGETNLGRFVYRLFIYVLPLEIQLSKRGEDYDPISWHNPATCLKNVVKTLEKIRCLMKSEWVIVVKCHNEQQYHGRNKLNSM
jgi:hypothetical protein